MNDEQLLIQLRDCFTGGYTLPQFCLDNKIRKPLFVTQAKFWQFVWEIYVQFRYDKRLSAQFSFINAPSGEINFSVHAILTPLEYKNISEVNPAKFDALICLTAQKIFSGKVIYLDALTDYFIRKTYAEIPLLNFLQRHPQVKLFLTNFPSIWRHKDAGDFNQQLKDLEEMRVILRADKSGNVQTPLDKFGYTNQEVLEIMEAPPITTNPDGSTVMNDTPEFPLQRILNGKRVTANQPAHFRNRIYFVGSCHHYGVNAPFDKTIASYLQKMLNEKKFPYRVENESQRYFNRYQDIFYNLNKLQPAPGDILFVWIDDMPVKKLPFVDVANAFDPPQDFREIFCVQGHVNELGYKILAEKYFAFLTANNFFRDVDFNYPTPPPQRIVTEFRRSSNRAAKIFQIRSSTLTSKNFGQVVRKSARSS